MLHQTGSVPRPLLPRPGQARCVASCAATVESAPKKSDSAASQSNGSSGASGPTIINGQILHSIEPARLDVINSLEREGWVEDKLVPMLRPVEKSWQPADYLPDGADPDFLDKVAELRSEAEKLPDDYLVVLVGDMVTEEGLPTYMTMLNTLDGVRDETGASGSPWARWTRAWTAEENRHGDLLNKYLYLTGKVNMRAIETTIQNLIGCGMNPKTENNPYLGFVYTSFQERATSVSHGNTARQAGALGNKGLEKICSMIAADEARHEVAYIKIVSELFKRDPDGAMLAFADMMRKQVIMPAHMMTDFEHEDKNGGRNLFADFSEVAQKREVYTAFDYAAIMEHLLKRWKIAERECVSGEAAKEQEYLVGLPGRVRKLSERMYARRRKAAVNEGKFSWIYDRPVPLG